MTSLEDIKARLAKASAEAVSPECDSDDVEYLVAEVEQLRGILGDIVAGEPGAVKLASRYLALPEAP